MFPCESPGSRDDSALSCCRWRDAAILAEQLPGFKTQLLQRKLSKADNCEAGFLVKASLLL